jgi:hypothetical protein
MQYAILYAGCAAIQSKCLITSPIKINIAIGIAYPGGGLQTSGLECIN